MKKSGKVLLGVLSVSALVGTGFAAWVVNNGIVSTASSIVTPTVDTEISYQHGTVVKLNLTEKDTDLKFAKDQDLTISYNLKATPADGLPTFNPYEEGIYESLSDDYVPDVKVTVTPVDKTSHEPLTGAALTAANSYVVAPSTVNIPYSTWLASGLEETGYELDLNFAWGSAVGETNPQTYITETYTTQAEQEAEFRKLINALTDVCYKVEFTVGATVQLGTIDIQTARNGSITVKDLAGNIIENGSSVREGTTLKVEATPATNYKLGTITVNGSDYTDSFTTIAGSNTISATFTAKEASYSVVSEHASVAVKQGDTTLEASSKITAGSSFTLEVTPDTNYSVTSVVVTQGATTLTPSEGVYTALDSVEAITITVVSEVSSEATISIDCGTGVSYKVNGETKDTTYSNTSVLGTEYTLTEITKSSDVDGLSYVIKAVKVNGNEVTAVDGTYTITLEEKDTTYVVTFEFSVHGTVNLSADENTTLEVSNNGTAVTAGTTVAEGTTLKITATPKSGYNLVSVTAKEGDADAIALDAGEDGTYSYTVLGNGAITISATSTETITEIADIQTTADETVTVIGHVIFEGSNNKNIALSDATGNVVTVNLSSASTDLLGTTIKVSGTVNGSGAKYLDKATWTETETVITPSYTPTNISSSDDYALITENTIGIYSFRGVSFKDGSYVNLKLAGTNLGITSYYNNTLDADKCYDCVAVISGLSSSSLRAYIFSSTEAIVDPTAVEWNLNKTSMASNEELTLSTSATPSYATYDVEYAITSGSEYATIDNGILKGISSGTVTVSATIKNSKGETILSPLVQEIEITSPSTTKKVEFNGASLGLSNSYASDETGVTVDSSCLKIKYVNLMKRTSDNSIQTRYKSGATSSLYNATLDGEGANKEIKSIKISFASETNTKSSFQLGFGTTENPALDTKKTYNYTDYSTTNVVTIDAPAGSTYFTLTRTGSGAMYISNIVVTFNL